MNKVYGIQLVAAFTTCAIFMTIFEGSQAGSFGLVLGPTIVWIGHVVWEIKKQSWSKEVQNKALLTMVYLAISGYIGQDFYLDQMSRGPIALHPLPELSIQELKQNGSSAEQLKQWMDGHITSDAYPSLQIAVADRSGVIFSHTSGNPDHQSQDDSVIYPVASVSKFLTNLLCLKLVEEGLLNVDDPLVQFLPPDITISPQPELGTQITIGMLMTHMSGLVRSAGVIRSNEDSYSDLDLNRIYQRLREEELRFKPGTDRSYSNLGMGILGLVLEKVSKQSYNELLQSRVATKLGLKDTYILDYADPEQKKRMAKPYVAGLHSPQESQPSLKKRMIGSGGLISTAHDLSLMGSMILTAKNLGVSQEQYDRYLSPVSYRNDDGSVGKKSKHALIARIKKMDRAGRCFSKNGGRRGASAYLIICPEIGISIGIAANRSVRPYKGSPDEIGDILITGLSLKK